MYRPESECRLTRMDVRGVEYAVHEWGDADAPTLLWLHGWGDTGRTCQFVVDALEHDWHVVAPDWRGFGRSGRAPGGYWFPDYLADLDVLLDAYSPDAAARLAGHSMGGNIAALYAGTFPERVTAFVDVEGFGLADSDPADAPARYRAWIERARGPLQYGHYPDHDALAARIRAQSPQMSAAAADWVAREWAAAGDGGLELRADPRHKLPNPVLYRRAEAEACWRRVTAPVLLVAGSASPMLGGRDPRLASDGLALPFPAREARVIDGAGHMLHFEAPAALAATIEEFLLPRL